MKGSFELMPTIFAVVFFLFTVLVSLIAFFSGMTVVTIDMVKDNFERLTVVDSAHNAKNCLNEGGIPEVSNIQPKIDACKKTLDIRYLNVLDISQKEYPGERKGSHSIYINIKNGKETRQAKLVIG